MKRGLQDTLRTVSISIVDIQGNTRYVDALVSTEAGLKMEGNFISTVDTVLSILFLIKLFKPMQNINCLADMINHVPRVRVIKEGDKNYGKEYDIVAQHFDRKSVTIIIDFCSYSYSEIQFLTPIQYEGRFIGLGDKVNGNEVFGYFPYEDGWNFFLEKGNYKSVCAGTDKIINSFEPIHKLTPKIELSTEEMVEELKRRGVAT